jgi:hypothetical protein
MVRAKCKIDTWNEHGKDPDLTHGRYYRVGDPNVIVMGHDSMMTVVGDNGEEVTRPKHLFQILKK